MEQIATAHTGAAYGIITNGKQWRGVADYGRVKFVSVWFDRKSKAEKWAYRVSKQDRKRAAYE